eukprot:TRINITY_DN6957_c0_g1_i1.p3 TRINITY_DN6957_c0_g1~~TRINITY_DN6957_c0_g1_i1.p3  ORF type:complete len:214 (+),score=43.51 TRINITY_DN6957_c0_g1_i1:59-643(+)
MADVAVIFDYDWSLIGTNSDTYIFEQLRPELLELLDGICEARGWTAAMDELLGRLAETGCSRAELEACVASVPFNVTLGEAVRALVGTAGIEMFVLSDANTVYIESFLRKQGLNDAFSVCSNPAFYEGERLRVRPWVDPSRPHACPLCPPNLCKGAALDSLLGSAWREKYARIVYIGDGGGDFCGDAPRTWCRS